MSAARDPRLRVLMLAGTAEARALAARLAGSDRVALVASLAGATRAPAAYPVETRIGGFGGADGLRETLAAGGFGGLIDAAHPFAQRIGAASRAACAALALPRLRLARPPWRPEPADRWVEVADEAAAARALPSGARAFLALGATRLDAFRPSEDVSCVARVADPPAEPRRGRIALIVGRPSANPETEAALLRAERVTHLVCRNSGGEDGYGKLAAARALGLPVIMVARPAGRDKGPVAETADAAAAIAEGWATRG